MNLEILYETPWFNVINVNDEKNNINTIGIQPSTIGVIIMPYTLQENGQFDKIGVLNEYNQLRNDNYSLTMVTGGVESNETTTLETAKRELLEETGYDVTDNDRWMFLGELSTSKLIQSEMFCYAVNITNIKPSEKKGDGSINEKLSTFNLITPSEAAKTKDSYILSMMMKYFIFKYSI